MDKVYWKDKNQDVQMYQIDTDSKMALCFSNFLMAQQGNGWVKIKLSKLIPYPYAEDYKSGCSKTQRNKIKSMLKLVSAEWECTDGKIYSHEYLESAIKHQQEILQSL